MPPSLAGMSERERIWYVRARSTVACITFSILILAAGIWLSVQSSTQCHRVLHIPFLVLGVFITVISIVSYCFPREQNIIALCYGFMFLFIIALFILTIFSFATGKGGGDALPGKEYKEYGLGKYSFWLKLRTLNWNSIKRCLKDHRKVCQSLIDATSYNSTTLEVFNTEPLSSLQSGCCKPSNDCNFIYVSPTNWTTSGGSYDNPDCSLWSNDQNVLCFDCQSCKAGILENVKHILNKMAWYMIVSLLPLSYFYLFGLWAVSEDE